MHKLVVLYPDQPDPERFKAYYVGVHLELVRQLPGLRGMRHSFDVRGVDGSIAYFCIFEADFDDGAALGAAMGSPAGQAVAQDVPKFAEVAPALIHYPVEDGA